MSHLKVVFTICPAAVLLLSASHGLTQIMKAGNYNFEFKIQNTEKFGKCFKASFVLLLGLGDPLQEVQLVREVLISQHYPLNK